MSGRRRCRDGAGTPAARGLIARCSSPCGSIATASPSRRELDECLACISLRHRRVHGAPPAPGLAAVPSQAREPSRRLSSRLGRRGGRDIAEPFGLRATASGSASFVASCRERRVATPRRRAVQPCTPPRAIRPRSSSAALPRAAPRGPCPPSSSRRASAVVRPDGERRYHQRRSRRRPRPCHPPGAPRTGPLSPRGRPLSPEEVPSSRSDLCAPLAKPAPTPSRHRDPWPSPAVPRRPPRRRAVWPGWRPPILLRDLDSTSLSWSARAGEIAGVHTRCRSPPRLPA